MDKIKTRESGVTLVELIIVIVIVGICFISVMGLFVNALRINMENEVRTIATSLAHGKMEEVLQKKDFDSMDDNFDGKSGTFNSPFSDYSYKINWNYVEKTDLNNSVVGPTEYKAVEVIVKHNLIENVEMRTLFTDY